MGYFVKSMSKSRSSDKTKGLRLCGKPLLCAKKPSIFSGYAKLSIKAVNSTACINKLLFTGIERVAFRAYFNLYILFR